MALWVGRVESSREEEGVGLALALTRLSALVVVKSRSETGLDVHTLLFYWACVDALAVW